MNAAQGGETDRDWSNSGCFQCVHGRAALLVFKGQGFVISCQATELPNGRCFGRNVRAHVRPGDRAGASCFARSAFSMRCLRRPQSLYCVDAEPRYVSLPKHLRADRPAPWQRTRLSGAPVQKHIDPLPNAPLGQGWTTTALNHQRAVHDIVERRFLRRFRSTSPCVSVRRCGSVSRSRTTVQLSRPFLHLRQSDHAGSAKVMNRTLVARYQLKMASGGGPAIGDFP